METEEEPTHASQPDQPVAQAPVVTGSGRSTSPGKLLVAVLGVVLLAIGLCGGYWYGSHRQETTTKPPAHSTAAKKPTGATSTVHFVKSAGYPIDDHTKLNISFGVPTTYQAVLGDANDTTATFLTTSYNNVLGSWYVGSPDATNPEYSSASIVAVDKDWLSGGAPLVTQPNNNTASYWNNVADSTDCPYALLGCHLQTAAERQKYLADIQTKTAACAKDSSHGFTTADGVFQACYTYNDTQNDSQLPLVIYGFGKVDGQPLMLSTSVQYPDGLHGSALSAWVQTWIDAVKQTTVKV